MIPKMPAVFCPTAVPVIPLAVDLEDPLYFMQRKMQTNLKRFLVIYPRPHIRRKTIYRD